MSEAFVQVVARTSEVEKERMATRRVRAWGLGTEFIVEERNEGVILRPSERFPETSLDQVAGSLRSKRGSKTPAQMRAAIGREIIRRPDPGRY